MHVEVHKGKLSTFREFTGEYLMIVVSIITALALEQVVQTYHHRHLAEEASKKIESELRANLHELQGSVTHNHDEEAKARKLRDGFLDDLKQGKSDRVALAALDEKNKHPLSLSVNSPSLQREAWDVAIANQSASWIEPARLERYAALYAHIRDVEAISNGGSNRFFDGPQMINVATDLQLGKASAQDVLRMLNQITVAYSSMNGNLENLKADLAKNLAQPEATVAKR
jgi:hypothetical protein